MDTNQNFLPSSFCPRMMDLTELTWARRWELVPCESFHRFPKAPRFPRPIYLKEALGYYLEVLHNYFQTLLAVKMTVTTPTFAFPTQKDLRLSVFSKNIEYWHRSQEKV